MIHLRDLDDEQTSFLDQAFIEGNIQDDQKLENLFINGKQILRTPGKKVYFNSPIYNAEGITDFNLNITGKDTMLIMGSISPQYIKLFTAYYPTAHIESMEVQTSYSGLRTNL